MLSENLLTVVATMKAKQGKASELREVLIGLLAPTRAEDGCVNYDLHESNDSEGTFLFYENWTSQAALDAHLQTPHLKAFFARHEELLEGEVQLSLMHPVVLTEA